MLKAPLQLENQNVFSNKIQKDYKTNKSMKTTHSLIVKGTVVLLTLNCHLGQEHGTDSLEFSRCGMLPLVMQCGDSTAIFLYSNSGNRWVVCCTIK